MLELKKMVGNTIEEAFNDDVEKLLLEIRKLEDGIYEVKLKELIF